VAGAAPGLRNCLPRMNTDRSEPAFTFISLDEMGLFVFNNNN
jgi:hypothetical protein